MVESLIKVKAVFLLFYMLYTKVRDGHGNHRIILVMDLVTVCLGLPSHINTHDFTSSSPGLLETFQ